MNVSQPVASSISGVSFNALSPDDVKKLSVKQITTAITIDNLLNPVPGGLWDPAFGAVANNPCSTCRLDSRGCPGHCGHIELPVKVFHCTFLDQAYRLLRAQCQYCHRFRMPKVLANLYWCKLKLIRHGLLDKVDQVEDAGAVIIRKSGTAATDGDESDASEHDQDHIIGKRKAFVRKCLREALREGQNVRNPHQTEAILAARKAVITAFNSEILKAPRCRNCNAYSASYRKNRSTAIFRKPLEAKKRAQNAQNELVNGKLPLATLNKQKQKESEKALRRERARAAMEIDEGVADLESSVSEDADDSAHVGADIGTISSEEEDAEPLTREGGEGNGSLIQGEATTAKKRKRPEDESSKQKLVNANEAHALLTLLFERERDVLRLVYQPLLDGPDPSCDLFFVQNLLVPPNKYRKEMKTTRGEMAEPPDNQCYKNILTASEEISQIYREVQGQAESSRARQRNFDDLQRSWLHLQDQVNTLFDRDKTSVRGYAALRIPEGVKQKLEKKDGLFRMNIMGKRVNFCARSVISPDPNIETNEIGVPPVFAKVLTYPEPVTSFTFEYLKQAVINGPDKWPGAAAIESETGQIVSLRGKPEDERAGLANMLLAPSSTNVTGVRNKKVHRHLNNGDMVIMNRQPTLHKPSMMCHRAKILHGEKTIRMHYANCHTYNADFDGDEMNMHFPQNENARAEALEIADTDHQYLSATAGKPLRGLIQDHVTMGTWTTCIDMFFTREEYLQLLYSCIRPENKHTENERILTVDPAVLRPKALWTGKQLITTLLKNIRPHSRANLFMQSACSTPADRWAEASEEGIVRIVDGELLTGVLDKKQIGPSSGGLIHSVYEVYGHHAAGRFTSILGRLLTRMLNMRAFSCGIEDLLLTDKGNEIRRERLTGAKTVGIDVASKYVTLESSRSSFDTSELVKRLEDVLRDDEKQANLDRLTNASTAILTAEIWEGCLPSGLHKTFPRNQMQTMTTSGAKGTAVNANHISCNLGQQVLEGRRVPVMVSGKTLPSFRPFETSARAGGYIVDRFLTGIRPQEFYFQLMAGREGLIDTAVKTSRSGYLQRCLGKGLEGLRVDHDSSVRDSDGSVIQSLYGEDGLEIAKLQKLTDFKFLSQNFLSLFSSLQVKDDAERMISNDAIDANKAALKAIKSGDLAASDPVLSLYPPFVTAGSTSEKYFQAFKKYIDENPDKTIRSKKVKTTIRTTPKDVFRRMLYLNYSKSVVQPGEAVGIVAAQSIGEPSTQMTLNTFHLAGFAAKNVTLGIPRLREILMTASAAIKKPTMTLYPNEELTQAACSSFAKSISRLPLSQIIDEASVEESVGPGMFPDSRIYKVRLDFFPASEYSKEYAITIADVAAKLEGVFAPTLTTFIRKEMKKRRDEKSAGFASDAHPDIGKAARRQRDEEPRAPQGDGNEGPDNADREGGESDEEEGGDGDATDAKRMAQLNEGTTFGDPDESEEEIARQGERDAEDAVQDSDTEDEGYGSGEAAGDAAAASQASPRTPKISKAAAKRSGEDRETRVKNRNTDITAFKFDERKGGHCEVVLHFPTSASKILLLDLVNRAAHATLIQEVPGLGQCTLTTENKERVIVTEGANLRAMRNFQHIIRPGRLLTNDIAAMLDLYGVEAARSLIIAETKAVFAGHNIDVDVRHLTLVADYMTRAGGYLPFSRMGIRDKTSPFAKMSFETTVGFLGAAVVDGEVEDLSSPSARITMGRVGRMGTGMCDVLMPVG